MWWEAIRNYKSIWTKTEDLTNNKLNGLQVYHDRYTKAKIRTYGDKVYTNFHGLNGAEDDIESESFTVISIDSSLVYENKFYQQVYLDNCAHKIVTKQIADYLDENIFED